MHVPGDGKKRRLGGLVASSRSIPRSHRRLRRMYKVPGLFKTTNGGRRWSRIGPPGKGNVLALTVDPTDPETIYAGMFDGRRLSRARTGVARGAPGRSLFREADGFFGRLRLL